LKFFIEQKINQNGGFMKKRISFCMAAAFLILVFSSPVQAQLDTIWTKTFGGINFDEGFSVQQTINGDYIITGSTQSFGAGEFDVWLIKVDTSGNTLWEKTFGGSGTEWGYSVLQTADGGYIISGSTSSFGVGNGDVWLVKTDSSGDSLWTKTYGGINIDAGKSIQQTIDGGFIITGVTTSFGAGSGDVWLVKTDSFGNALWTKTLGGSEWDNSTSIQQTSDEGYIVTGYTKSFGSGDYDVWLIKTNSSGDTIWTKTFGGYASDVGYSVQLTTDGGYIITGYTNSFGLGNADVWLIKTDSLGIALWTKTFGGVDWDGGFSVLQNTDGGYDIIGVTASFSVGSLDAWLIETDSSGNKLWTDTFGGIGTDEAESFQQITNGGFIIVGRTESFGAGDYDVWLIKTEPDISIIESDTDLLISEFSLQQNYPNPFNPSTKISWQSPVGGWQTLKVYDLLGNEVATLVNEYKPAGKYEVEFDASSLTSGVYFYQMSAENYIETKKMLLIK
jgi:hypothetical protein